MSDRIGVMRDGRLVQVGTPREIYTAPESRFVSEFMGEVNSLPVVLRDDGKLFCEPLGIAFDPPPGQGATRAGRGTLVVRPEDMRFADDAAGAIEGEIFNEYLLGSRVQYQVKAGPVTLLVERLRDAERPDRRIALRFDPADSMLFPE